jgi:hypothetical protein
MGTPLVHTHNTAHSRAEISRQSQVFFVKYNDPIYVKLEKLDVMIRLANESNIQQVLAELKEYATEVDVDFVRKCVLLPLASIFVSAHVAGLLWRLETVARCDSYSAAHVSRSVSQGRSERLAGVPLKWRGLHSAVSTLCST